MSPPQTRTFLLSRKALTALTRVTVGKLHPVAEMDETARPCRLLDTYDQRLLARHQLLILTAGQMELLARGSDATQPGAVGPVAALPAGPVAAALQDLPASRSLCVLAEGRLQAGRLRLEDGEGKTRVRAHLRLLTVEDEAAVLVTLLPLRGYDRAAEALAQALVAQGARPLTRERVTDLLLPDLPPCRAEIDIPSDATVYEAATAILRAQFDVALAHEAGVLADADVEFLHKYRVAFRKMRLVASLFRTAWRPDQAAVLKSRLGALMRPTGAQRDLDVLLQARPAFQDRLPPALHPGLADLFDLIAEDRARAHAALAEALRSTPHRTETEGVARLLQRQRLAPGKAADRPFRAFAAEMARDVDLAIAPDAPDAALHALRLRIKARRYLMDFLGEGSRPLRRLQDQLGRFNDLCVQGARLQALLARHPQASLDTAQAVGALRAVLHDEARTARAEALDLLKEMP